MILRSVTTILSTCAVVVCALMLVGCEDDAGPRDRVVLPPHLPDDESWNATITFTDSVGTRARVRVGHVRRYVSSMRTLLDSGVQAEFFAPDGSISAVLTSDSAHIDDRTRDMSAYGRVHVVGRANGTVVDTDRLFWERNGRTLRSDAHVAIDNPERNEHLEGSGFQSDETLRSYTIFNITGRTRALR